MNEEILNTIFRAYDIRGKYPSELNAEFYKKLGMAYVTKYIPKKVAVGYDMRSSSIELYQSLIEGITSMGCDVVNLGEIATEAIYFVVGEFNDIFDGGFVVTASHNDSNWNGCKIIGKNADFIGLETGLLDLKNIILEDNFNSVLDRKGTVTDLYVYPIYKRKVLSFIKSPSRKPLKIIVDAGNGMGGRIFEFIFDDLDLDIEKLYFEPDGKFPNHVPNPMEEENVEEIKKKVIETNADFGIAMDGDADRVFFIDKKGRNLSGAYTGILLAMNLIKKENNKRIIYDTKITWPYEHESEKLGFELNQSITGRQNFKKMMNDKEALFGAEASSHFYYRDFYNCDSGMITIAQMINMYFEGFELTKEVDYLFDKYPNSGEVNYQVVGAPSLMHKIEEHYIKEGAKIEKIDGLSVEFEDWRFNLRMSNTQPLLRINLEATTKEKVVEKFLEVEGMIGAKRDNIPALEELR